MGDFLASMGPAVANHLWQSTAFAAVAWALALLLRRNQARLRYGLWLAASVKFVVPFALLIALGGMLPRPQHAMVTLPVYSAVDEVGLPFSDEVMPVVAAGGSSQLSVVRSQKNWSMPVMLGMGWVCGVVVVVGVWCCRWLSVARLARTAVRVESGREVEALRRVERTAGMRREMELRITFPGSTCGRTWGTRPGMMEPGVFGVLWPVLIWPEGLSERLDDAHIEAILAHELMHVRRCDNLTATLHMLVQAVFWFHPAVWWMGARLVEERERACDEAVLEMGSRPGVYADSLLKAVRFCVESPLACVSGVTGADLKQRVRSIMTLRMKRLGLAGKVALSAVAIGMIAGPVAFGVVRMIPMYGQALHATGPLPSFEVATIKSTSKDETRSGMGVTDGGRGFRTTNATARDLIQEAYDLKSTDQILGASGWMTTEHFDIEARMDDAQADRLKSMPMEKRVDQVRLMVQSLLAERFGLKLHESTRESSVFALEVAKGGAKLKPTAMAAADPHGVNAPHPAVGPLVSWMGPGKIQATGVGLPLLADALGRMPELGSRGGFTMGEMVVDKTGLTGMYDWTLNWSPDNASGGLTENADAPSLFAALQEQLGLKLVKAKTPVEVMVIDHIEKPVFDEADVPAKSSVVVTAVAAGQQMLAKLVPAALVQEKTTPTGVVVSAGPGAAAIGVAITPEEAAIAESIQFDVASFRVNNTNQPGATFLMPADGDGLVILNRPMRDLIRFAYNVTSGVNFHFANEPAWINEVKWDIRAKVAPEDLAKWQKLSNAGKTLTLRRFCVEQLKLKFHEDTTPYTYYNLVVDKRGVKMAEAGAGDDPNLPYMRAPEHSVIWLGPGLVLGHAGTTTQLAVVLSGHTPWVVHDETGLTSAYNFVMSYAPGGMYDPRAQALGMRPSVGSPDDDRPSLFTAVEQLGLKMVVTKGPLEGMVIDHVERPEEN